MTATCEKCNKTFANKYTLKTHIEANTCGNNKSETNCSSSKCDYKSVKKSDLQKHIKTCKYVEIDMIVNNIQQEHRKEIENIRLEHSKEILRIKEECMEKEQERMTSLLEKVMTKPVITQNNTTTTIKGNNNNLQNILASKELYDKQTDPERIKSIDHSIVEKHFWLGQKGIARFCVDQIVKTTDEDGSDKMLLCCTDPSRKRFKYVDGENQVVEDIDARHFINTVSAPIVTVCREVYDGVVKKIEDDMKETTDAFDLNLLENKTNVAQQKFLEINNIGDHSRNSEYKHEMTILLKK
jgi:hypothetical protein